MNKKELRKKYKELRQQLTEDALIDMSLAIANRMLQLDVWDKMYFHLFLTIEEQKEIDTEFILQILAGKDKEIVVSKSDFDTFEMTHFLLTDNTKFRTNSYHISEPIDGLEVPDEKIDVVFVPLLAFDLKGHRVGYGKGFYDKFLSKCNPEVVKIGLSFFEVEEEISDATENDVKLDFCVTPNKIYTF
jgi:5-formyltetrahydrofolate cyclo-ligase